MARMQRSTATQAIDLGVGEMPAARRGPPRSLRRARARPSRGGAISARSSAQAGSLSPQAAGAGLVQRVHQLAEDVELELAHGRRCRCGPGASRSSPASQGTRSTRSSRRSPARPYMIWIWSGRPATARSSQSRQASRLVEVAAVHQRDQRHGGVAQPAEAVVPVALAAELLGQRGGRRGDDAAGGGVGQRLQGDERAADGLAGGLAEALADPVRRLAALRPGAPDGARWRRAPPAGRTGSGGGRKEGP